MEAQQRQQRDERGEKPNYFGVAHQARELNRAANNSRVAAARRMKHTWWFAHFSIGLFVVGVLLAALAFCRTPEQEQNQKAFAFIPMVASGTQGYKVVDVKGLTAKDLEEMRSATLTVPSGGAQNKTGSASGGEGGGGGGQ